MAVTTTRGAAARPARLSGASAKPAVLQTQKYSHAAPNAPASPSPGALPAACLAALASFMLSAEAAHARPTGVNRPELLPAQQTPVIDVAGFLTPSEERRIQATVEELEQDTGFRLRVLAQNYPDTPGMAVREYWGVDERTIVFVADPTFGDILNFNVGQEVDLEVPRSFWSRLAGKFGNKFFWQQQGEAASVLNAVTAIDNCLREPAGRLKCSNIQGEAGL